MTSTETAIYEYFVFGSLMFIPLMVNLCSTFPFFVYQVFRKAALKYVMGDDKEVVSVTPDNLKEFVGNPIFNAEKMYEITPPGVTVGLAWTSMG